MKLTVSCWNPEELTWFVSEMISRLKLFGDVSTPKCWWAESMPEDEDEDDDEDDEGDVVVEVNAELKVIWGGGGGDDEPREFITDHALVPLPFLFVNKVFAWFSWDCCWCNDCCCCCLQWVDVEQGDDVEDELGGELSLDSFELVRPVADIVLVAGAVVQLFA